MKNTALLLQYGIDCHVVDKNGKSALHIMAEEIGISRVDVIQYWRKVNLIFDPASLHLHFIFKADKRSTDMSGSNC